MRMSRLNEKLDLFMSIYSKGDAGQNPVLDLANVSSKMQISYRDLLVISVIQHYQHQTPTTTKFKVF